MTVLRRVAAIGAVTVMLGATSGAVLAQQQGKSPDEIIAARQAGYKRIGEAFEAMKKAIEAGQDVSPLQPRAQEIVDWAKQIPSMFPPGTETGHKTHAKPEIWSNLADFDKRSTTLEADAQKLVQLAAANDKAGFAAQWKVTGQTCGGCHRNYRTRIQ